jgi:hypothetical protein
LGRDAELASDLGLADAGGEQLGCAQPTRLEPFAFSLGGEAQLACPDPHLPISKASTRP